MATPATTTQMKLSPACQKIKFPAITAASAYLYPTSPLASFTRLSPSIIVMSRGSSPSPRVTDVAATASDGDTMAPIKKHSGQLTSGIILCATMATMVVERNTSPTAASEMDLQYFLDSC